MNYHNVREKLKARKKELDQDFDRQKETYRQLQEYVAPWAGFALSSDGKDEKVDGARKDESVIDSTALYSLDVLAAGMHSGLTSPSRPWFKLGVPDEGLNDAPAVKGWLYQVERLMGYVFSRSNIYQSYHRTYGELGAFGTAALGMFKSFEKVIHCRSFTAGEYRIALSNDLAADTFLYTSWMTVKQIVQEFGISNVSTVVKDAYEKNRLEQLHQVSMLIEPNDDRMPCKDFMGRAFRCVHFETASNENSVLRVAGFDSFPVMAPRWDVVAGKIYGVGPGHKTLGDVKMLQKMQTKSLIALDKEVDPPLVGHHNLNGKSINTMPGGVTLEDQVSGGGGLRAVHNVSLNRQNLELSMQQVRTQIKTGFYNDLFLMLANMPMRSGVTATEIAERHEEKLIMLGPVLGRLYGELLDPSIDRTFNLLVEADLIPPPPEEIQEMELQVEYISMLAQAQKAVGIGSVNQFLGFVGNMAGVKPEVLDKVDFDEAVDVYADLTGTPPKLIKPDEVVAESRNARAQQEAQARMSEMVQPAAQSVKMLSEAKREDGSSVLDALSGGGNG